MSVDPHPSVHEYKRAANFALTTRKRARNACYCGLGSSRKRRYNRWGSFIFYKDEYSKVSYLSDDCKCAEFQEPKSHLAIGATYFGCGRLLRRAVGITFSLRYGAGGAGICANLNYYTVVNDKIAPMFRLMRILNTALSRSQSFLKQSDVSTLFGECSSRIRHLYMTGKARPKDITPRGESIMHIATHLVNYSTRFGVFVY
jgi:hypothetical protein